MSKILTHPAQPKRAWQVSNVGPGLWTAALIGGRDPKDNGPMNVETGSLHLVVEALKHRHIRQGLPVVVVGADIRNSEVAA